MRVVDEVKVTVPTVKKILEELDSKGVELDPLQRRVLDYATKFSKVPPEDAEKTVERLVEVGVERDVAIQMVNCLPKSLEEVRVFIGRHRIISEETLKKILDIIKEVSG